MKYKLTFFSKLLIFVMILSGLLYAANPFLKANGFELFDIEILDEMESKLDQEKEISVLEDTGDLKISTADLDNRIAVLKEEISEKELELQELETQAQKKGISN